MTNKIIEAAREAELLDHRDTVGTVPGCYAKALERFYAIAYRQGLEDAAKVCDTEICTCCWEDDASAAAEHLANTIRAMKEEDHG